MTQPAQQGGNGNRTGKADLSDEPSYSSWPRLTPATPLHIVMRDIVLQNAHGIILIQHACTFRREDWMRGAAIQVGMTASPPLPSGSTLAQHACVGLEETQQQAMADKHTAQP